MQLGEGSGGAAGAAAPPGAPGPAGGPGVSVIVSTNGRRASLEMLLASLRFQQSPAFEVCVVAGPAADGTAEFLQPLAERGAIKLAACPEPNLSRSRNIGIALAAGELIAFIDDDALPEPDWLSTLLPAFDDPGVAGAGGLVRGPDGRSLQFRYSSCDRFGLARHDLAGPAGEGNFPFSAAFPHVMGTNCAFRRGALAALGGFDEEYEYYLDETDLCCRLVDEGLLIRQTGRSTVHHRMLPGTARGEGGAPGRSFPVLKNQIYFSLVNGRDHAAMEEILRRSMAFVDGHRNEVRARIAADALPALALADFEAEAERAWSVGLARGLAGTRRLRPAGFFADPPPFRPFPALPPGGGGLQIVLLTDPAREPASHAAALARGALLARAGHLVRVLSPADGPRAGEARVGWADGAWLHPVPVERAFPQPSPDRLRMGGADWNRAAALLAEVDRLALERPVDLVDDAGGGALSVAVALTGRYRLWLREPAADDPSGSGGDPRAPRRVAAAGAERIIPPGADASPSGE